MDRVLLIVDDMPAVARSLSRFLRNTFDRVLVAHNVEQAEVLLADPSSPPTHLISDHFLSDGGNLGSDLIPIWRKRFPHLRVAVLLTGAGTTGVQEGDGVDAVFRKPPDAVALRDYMRDSLC